MDNKELINADNFNKIQAVTCNLNGPCNTASEEGFLHFFTSSQIELFQIILLLTLCLIILIIVSIVITKLLKKLIVSLKK